ncbi:hypothetical protein ACIRPK_32080 [Kitasatospora sp. NPDC101801]|uniref:hypothetical protein n=1 Tax=Kitasatospora sp. NPDC101801 TaxID=3364103 RepID=UPI0037F289C2
MLSHPAPCSSNHPQQCALLLRRSVIKTTGWTATGPVLAIGTQAARLAAALAERHSPVLTLATDGSTTSRSGPHTRTLAADPLLLPTLGLPALSLALVSGCPPSRTEQLLRDLDTLLLPGSTVLFVPARQVPDLLPYMAPAETTAFHRLQAVRLDHARCANRPEPEPAAPPTSHGATALAAARPQPGDHRTSPPGVAGE